jgi:glycosyltransferase involved in cell wall biosynthesis
MPESRSVWFNAGLSLSPMSEHKHAITILILAYKAEDTIVAAINGALAQTIACEIIISDDASPDNTFQLALLHCAHYSGPHQVMVRRNEVNQGVTAHLNGLLELAKGTIIMFMAGDDISYPHRVFETLKAFDTNPEAYVMGSACDEIDMQGKPIRYAVRALPERFNLRYFAEVGKMATLLGAAMAFRREIFDRFGPLRGSVEDNVLTLRGALLGGGLCLPTALMQYRQNPQSLGNWLFARGDKSRQAFRRRYERTCAMYLAIADDLESCLDKVSFPPEQVKIAKSIINIYRLEAEARLAILNMPRRQWWGPIWRGVRQPGLRRKSLERAIKLFLPKSWFGLRP